MSLHERKKYYVFRNTYNSNFLQHSLQGYIELIVNFFLKESVTTYRSLIFEIHIIQAYYIMFLFYI